MKDLPIPKIHEILENYPNAKKIAVENFLMTVGSNDNPIYARLNLDMDARLYGWNKETINAIKEGIEISKHI